MVVRVIEYIGPKHKLEIDTPQFQNGGVPLDGMAVFGPVVIRSFRVDNLNDTLQTVLDRGQK